MGNKTLLGNLSKQAGGPTADEEEEEEEEDGTAKISRTEGTVSDFSFPDPDPDQPTSAFDGYPCKFWLSKCPSSSKTRLF